MKESRTYRWTRKFAASHLTLFKVFTMIAVGACIVYLMPREVKFSYVFQVNTPWKYDNLYANYSFNVEKNTSALESERQEIRNEQKQYYTISEQKNHAIKEQFKVYCENIIADLIEDSEGFLSFDKKEKLQQVEYWKEAKRVGEPLLSRWLSEGIASKENKDIAKGFLSKGNRSIALKSSEIPTKDITLSKINGLNTATPVKYALKEVFQAVLVTNIVFDKTTTEQEISEAILGINPIKSQWEKERLIVSKGEKISAATYEVIRAYEKEFKERNSNAINTFLLLLGQILMVGLSLLVLFLYLQRFRSDVYEETRNVAFIFLMVLLLFTLSEVCQEYFPNYMYVIPFCLLPIILRSFYDTRLAIFTHLITILLVSFIVPQDAKFLFVQWIGGVAAILTVSTLYTRAELFSSIFKIIVVYNVSYYATELLQSTSLVTLDWDPLWKLTLSGGFVAIAPSLVFVFERIFGLTSDISLLELADTNNKLLKQLQQKAPGTFQHSLQVANLAEAGADALGANTLLTRVGALYHDIGKMKNPLFFIENQSTGVNPHDDIEPLESAEIIINHVVDGVEMAKKFGLPERILDFIRTHHGDSTVQYFLYQYKQQHGEEHIPLDSFKYRGPRPFSKETAILLLADSVEAASKSIKEPNIEKISTLVEQVIDKHLQNNQLDNANITLAEIAEIKKIFILKLRNIYHLRIEYPSGK